MKKKLLSLMLLAGLVFTSYSNMTYVTAAENTKIHGVEWNNLQQDIIDSENLSSFGIGDILFDYEKFDSYEAPEDTLVTLNEKLVFQNVSSFADVSLEDYNSKIKQAENNIENWNSVLTELSEIPTMYDYPVYRFCFKAPDNQNENASSLIYNIHFEQGEYKCSYVTWTQGIDKAFYFKFNDCDTAYLPDIAKSGNFAKK